MKDKHDKVTIDLFEKEIEMTTEVIIKAHCSHEKHVIVDVTRTGNVNPDEPIDSSTLENGESVTKYAYDDRVISVREVRKL